jgi:hypothetical protein
VNDIDPVELIPKPLESFKRPGLTAENAQKLFAANKKKRGGLLSLV